MGLIRILMRKFCIAIVLFFLFIFIAPCSGQEKESSDRFYMRGAFYLDWFGVNYEGEQFYSQLGIRINLEMFNRRGSGWTLKLDGRDRFRVSQEKHNQVIFYDACMSYENAETPLYFSVGQMNLYDTAGIGQLLGGALGLKPTPNLLLGGYAGLESDVYINRVGKDHQKFGFFAHYMGNLGKRLSLSYNHIRYSGMTEQQYLYFASMYPIKKLLVLYGNLEYQLGSNIQNKDRLSRLFLNMRFDPSSMIDVSAFYSSGKGLDFHRYVLEKSQDPIFNDQQLERYYYSTQYGLRLSIKPSRGLRFYISRQESEQKDDQIRNHSWIFGGSSQNILKTGFSVYGNYRSNRGEISESDSYYLSISKDFGGLSWNLSFSNTYNCLRFDHTFDGPQPVHLDDYKTVSTYIFLVFNRAFAASLEYEYFIQEELNQHMFFLRLIYRK
jgi:hypothetical protein